MKFLKCIPAGQVIFSTRRSIMQGTSTADSQFWAEICSTTEQREDFYSIGAQSFQHGTMAKYFIVDPAKRRPFLEAYFRYRFEEMLVDGRAILGCIKKNEDVNGKKEGKIAYYGVYVYDTRKTFNEDNMSEMSRIDKEATRLFTRRDKWRDETIHEPIRRMAKDMGTVAWYMSRQMTTEEYKGHNIASTQSAKLSQIMKGNGLERHKKLHSEPLKIPPLSYICNSDTYPGAFKMIERIGFEMVRHYDYNYKPGVKCYLDPSAQQGEETGCNLLYFEKSIAPLVRQKLKKHSPIPESVL